MQPGDWNYDRCHVAACVFEEDKLVLQRVAAREVHVRKDTDEFMAPKRQSFDEAICVVDPPGHSP
jgi:hypothetical protein